MNYFTSSRARYVIAISVMYSFFFLVTPTAHAALTDGLVSFWGLNESSGVRVDSVGNNDLSVSGGSVSSTTGKILSSQQFEEGATGFLTVADNGSLDVSGGDFSISLWVYLDNKTGTQVFASKYASGGYAVYYEPIYSAFAFTTYSGVPGSVAQATLAGDPSTGTWYHIVATHNATTHTNSITINDQYTNTATSVADESDTNAPFTIGGFGNTGILKTNGRVDAVGFWNRTLTNAEITALYNSGSGIELSGGTPVTVSSVSPTDNAVNIPVDSNLVITFSENVVTDTGNIVIYKKSDDSVFETIPVGSSKVTGSGTDTITINPGGTFGSADYYIQIAGTAFKNASDVHYAGISDKTTWNFLAGNLMAHWKFDEGSGTTAIDSAGADHNGTISGATYSTNIPTVSFTDPYSLDFDGINDGINTPLSLNHMSAFTLAGWAYPRSSTNSGGWFGANDVFEFFFSSPTTLRCWTGTNASVDWSFAGNPDFLNNWHHIVCSGDGDNVTLSVDGTQVANTPHAHTNDYGTGDNFSIGYGVQSGGTSNPFDGLIDDVRVYNRALTSQELESLGTGSAEPVSKPLATTFSPLDGAVDVAVGAHPTILFDRSVVWNSEPDSVRLYKKSDDSLVYAQAGGSGSGTNTLPIAFPFNLEENTEYYILIDANAISDLDGNFYDGIADSTVWQFKIGDFTAPVLTEVSGLATVLPVGHDGVYRFRTNEMCELAVTPPTSTTGDVSVLGEEVVVGQTIGITMEGMKAGGTYSFKFSCIDAAGNESNRLDVGPFTVAQSVIYSAPTSGGKIITTSNLNNSVPANTSKNNCSVDQILTQNIKSGSRDGIYSSYTKGIVTEAKILQAHLNRLGFKSGPVDGILGKVSDGAIKRMQSFLKTNVDGHVGPMTRKLLNTSCK